ncbi:putative secreted protein [Propionispora sp. 2/2-37]|uniref:peptide ABC transporter substrate-binding protein n=1 Tax=Propionispora sp. 2/2-37 TaxID=1677858 RepID=UPI0006C52BAA|nr:peptide ABC transporter substrate-binding protein [Propionispora sp. 2/2-37]CUH95569.1 putative secreted protein [Propionispora sp. 2/2-37]
MRYFYKLILVSIMVAALFTTGCAKPEEPGAQQKPGAMQGKIKAGGQLTYGSLQEPNTLNPLLSDLLSVSEVSSLIFNGLLITNEKGEWLPDLAVAVPSVQNGGVSRDGLTITYKLREGVTWHDGAPFTAEDVKFTWQMIMNPKVNVVSREGYNKIAAIDTPDASTVIVRFKEAYASYLNLFPFILPKHILENVPDINKAEFNRAPIGTGPFKLKEWRMAEAIFLEANPQFFRGKPLLDEIEYKVIPEFNLLLSQLKSGEIDIACNIDFLQLDQIKAIEGVKVVIVPNMIWEHMDFNLDNELFQDVKVRQAIALGIDRQAITTQILKGTAVPAAGDQPPISWAYNPAAVPAGRDVDKARQLLTEAGWQPGPEGIFAKGQKRLRFSLAVPLEDKTREAVAQMIAQELQELGIAVEVRPVEKGVFFSDMLKNRRFETALYAWFGGNDPDNISLWNSKYIPSRNNGYTGQNYPGWRNAEVDALTGQALHTLDIETRKQAYFRIQDILSQEYPVVPLYYHTNIDVIRNNLENYKANPTLAGSLWNAWEWGFSAK